MITLSRKTPEQERLFAYENFKNKRKAEKKTDYTLIDISLESSKKEIELMKFAGSTWLKYYNEGNFNLCEAFEDIYNASGIRLQNAGIDITKKPICLPKNLEELIK